MLCCCYSMEVWPGFQTSILRYEFANMLQLEITHKLLSTKTCFDIILQAQHGRDAVDRIRKELIGQIVLTRSAYV